MGIIGTLYTISFRDFKFQLVPLIPYSAIAKQSSSDLLFFIFYECGKSTFKITIKTKTTTKQQQKIIQKTYKAFSYSLSYMNTLCFITILT